MFTLECANRPSDGRRQYFQTQGIYKKICQTMVFRFSTLKLGLLFLMYQMISYWIVFEYDDFMYFGPGGR